MYSESVFIEYDFRDLPFSVKESPRDKAHRVVFRLTWTLADAIVFLILSNDDGNPKDQQDRNHPILSEDAANVLRSAIRDARRKAREEEDIGGPFSPFTRLVTNHVV